MSSIKEEESLNENAWIEAALIAGSHEHYEDAALYDHEYRRRRRDLRWYREAVKRQGSGAGQRILELGCGSGRLLLPLLRDGHSVVGVDRARPMLRACQQRIARLPQGRQERATLIQGDMRALPIADAHPFPVILCPFNAFMHLYDRQDIEACLSQVKRLLAPGGLFAFDVLNPDIDWLNRDPGRRWSRTRFRHPVSGEHLIYTTNHIYDPVRQVALVHIFYEPAPAEQDLHASQSLPRARLVHLAQRQFFPAELEALLHYNGFTIESRDGGFDGQPLDHESHEQVICARVR